MQEYEKNYNGWYNWDTWIYNLIITNSEDLYNTAISIGKVFKYEFDNNKLDNSKAITVIKVTFDNIVSEKENDINLNNVNYIEILESVISMVI